MDNNIKFLQENFPEKITFDQLYKICHISKRKAKWLLGNKIIPCQDSGKKTWRYTIKKSDVILYLQKCDSLGLKDLAPTGMFSSQQKRPPRKVDEFQELYAYLELPEHRDQLRQFYVKKFMLVPDALVTLDIVTMTGFSKTAVNDWIQCQHFKAYRGKTNKIPKMYLIEFLCSDYYVRIRRRSTEQRADMLSFLELIKSK